MLWRDLRDLLGVSDIFDDGRVPDDRVLVLGRRLFLERKRLRFDLDLLEEQRVKDEERLVIALFDRRTATDSEDGVRLGSLERARLELELLESFAQFLRLLSHVSTP